MKIAAAQMMATSDIEQNFATCKALVEKASQQGVRLLSLPECFAFIGEKKEDLLSFMRPIDSPLVKRYCGLAKEYGLWLSLGGLQEKATNTCSQNAHLLIDEKGEIRKIYRKLHLFDVDIPGGPRLMESDSAKGGDAVVVTDSPLGKLGLCICYDLRFAEQFLVSRMLGAEIILVPAAFTATTGKAHWEVLLRARAIETQCYIVAAAQVGNHNAKRKSHGDAMVVDPWGQVISRCGEGSGLAIAEIDLEYLREVRTRMPVMEHRRSDVYGTLKVERSN